MIEKSEALGKRGLGNNQKLTITKFLLKYFENTT